jgi:hypothetical protein
MKRESDDDALLKDVFGEAAPASLRETMLGESLRMVRRRYRSRRLGRAAALLVVLGLAVVLIRPSTPRRPDVLSQATPAKAKKSYTLVRSRPLLAAAMVVRTICRGDDGGSNRANETR